MTETLAYGYSADSTQQELSNKYQYEMSLIVVCILVHWAKVASASEGLSIHLRVVSYPNLMSFVPSSSNADATFL